jgi:hypothetical protein
MYKFDQFILLLQIKLQVEAWCADKTAEALRCQKLLEEEEEAAQKRLATIVHYKIQKASKPYEVNLFLV